MGIKFVPFHRRENRRSLAIFFAEEIAHLGALKIARFCGGAVKIAAATAENRAILVHSVVIHCKVFSSQIEGKILYSRPLFFTDKQRTRRTRRLEGAKRGLDLQIFCQSSGRRRRRSAKGVRSLFFCSRDSFGHFSVTFSDASVTFFPSLFCQTPFAGLLLQQGEKCCRRSRSQSELRDL